VTDETCHEEDEDEEQPVPEETTGVKGLRKQDVADRFIEKVGDYSPESGEADEPPLARATGKRETQHEAEKEVAGEEHL
jgi:hypothetical protein